MAFCMILTAGTELGTNQWIAALMQNISQSPILLLVWVSGIMAIARQFGGTLIHNMKPTVVLFTSATLAFAGLLMLGYTTGVMTFVSAAVFALGVAFFWPSMLGFVSENIPTSGALGLAIMGGIGFLGGAIAQPTLGHIFDLQTAAAGGDALAGGANTLKLVAVIPAVLMVAFGYLYFRMRKIPAN
jgi:fucose permease